MCDNRPEGCNRSRCGFTLVELMVSLLIVGIVMLGWWRIMNATAPYREAQRRAAVEVAAGMLDILPDALLAGEEPEILEYAMDHEGGLTASNGRQRYPEGWLPSDSPLRYVLTISKCEAGDSRIEAWQEWRSNGSVAPAYCTWATIRLYDSEYEQNCVRPFATFHQLLAAGSNPDWR